MIKAKHLKGWHLVAVAVLLLVVFQFFPEAPRPGWNSQEMEQAANSLVLWK